MNSNNSNKQPQELSNAGNNPNSTMRVFRWFCSAAVREVSETCRQVKRLVNEQRDLLSPQAIDALETARGNALATIDRGASKTELKAEIEKLNAAAGKWLKSYPNAAVRENIKEFQVAIVTILAFTTFFLQLTKIPTGSMQPSLWGITYENLAKDPNAQIPGTLSRFLQYWTLGLSYKELTAPFDGYVLKIEPEHIVLPFVKRQKVLFGDPRDSSRRAWLALWFPPDDRWPQAARISGEHLYRKGEPIVKLKGKTGDHLLVDRFTYNFRQPERGEVIVFKTKGIQHPDIPQDVLYIKRLVALPDEKVQIGNDSHLRINGRKLDERDPGFENVYNITDPGESHYSGHVNQFVAQTKYHLYFPIAPLFPDENTIYQVPPRRYLPMGDNTLNSLDSRSWGSLPQQNVIGRCWFIYWPFTRRFGWKTW